MAKQEHSRKEGETDAAALAAGALAVVLTTYMDEGRYDLFEAAVSLTLFGTLVAYLFGKPRNVGERMALAAVAGLVTTPIIGFVIELFLARDRSVFFSWTVDQAGRPEPSSVAELPTVVVWAIVAIIVGFWDFCLASRSDDPPRGRRDRSGGNDDHCD